MTSTAAVKHFQSMGEVSHIYFDEQCRFDIMLAFFLCKKSNCFKRVLTELGAFSNSSSGQLGELGILLTLHPLSNGDG